MTSNTHRPTVTMTALIGLTLGFAAPAALAQPGWVLSHQKISDTEGGFTGILSDDLFGESVASLGDLDGDGVGDLAVGAIRDDDGGNNRGAVWVLFLDPGGTVKSHQKISDTEGGFMGILDDVDYFGGSVASLGDLDGDGVGDLAVGARGDDDGGQDTGAMRVLFLNPDGTVKSHQKISDTEGGFTGILDPGDWFSDAVASLGDLDGDGVGDLVVGAKNDDDGGQNRGAVWVVFLNPHGTVKSHQKISDTEGGFTGTLNNGDRFGRSVTSLGDLDGDGVTDLAVGAYFDDDGGGNRGAVWVLSLNRDGTVKSHQKISDTEGGFTGILGDQDVFGGSVASLGDLDGDGVGDLAVGAELDDDGGQGCGAVWVLFLDTDGTVKSHQKISDTEGGFSGILNDADHLGFSAAALGDLDGDGVGDLAVGARGDDDGGPDRGAVWVLFLNTDGVPACPADLDADGEVGFADLLAVLSAWGSCPPECREDLDGSGDVGFGDLLLVLSSWGSCPQPGACCLPTGSCVQTSIGGDGCANHGGVYSGDGTLCADVVCPTGACCLPDGSCILTPLGGIVCANQGGVYQGDDTLCADVVCPIGACCFPNGSCWAQTEEACANAGGTFAGAGIPCSVVDCTLGACCFAGGECTVLPQETCEEFGGTYQGGGSTCEGVDCP